MQLTEDEKLVRGTSILGLLLLLLTIPVLWAGVHAIDWASASALRWGLGCCFLFGSGLVWFRQSLAAEKTSGQCLLVHAGVTFGYGFFDHVGMDALNLQIGNYAALAEWAEEYEMTAEEVLAAVSAPMPGAADWRPAAARC